jgi:hypothetical protein
MNFEKVTNYLVAAEALRDVRSPGNAMGPKLKECAQSIPHSLCFRSALSLRPLDNFEELNVAKKQRSPIKFLCMKVD